MATLALFPIVPGHADPLPDPTVYINFGGQKRSFVMHKPDNYRPANAYPMMLVAAGKNGTGYEIAGTTGFDALADQYGFFAIYPNLAGPVWSLDGPNNDVDFFEKVVAVMESHFTIDATRIYISGFADGGRLATTYACTQTPQTAVAGVAIVANDMNTTDQAVCQSQPQTPSGFLMFHGTADHASPYNGGREPNGTVNLSAQQSVNVWAAQDGCTGVTSDTTVADELSNGVMTTDDEQLWQTCQNGVSVGFYTITGGGHSWPGSVHRIQNPVPQTGPVSLGLNASLIIWQTFSPLSAPTATVFARP